MSPVTRRRVVAITVAGTVGALAGCQSAENAPAANATDDDENREGLVLIDYDLVGPQPAEEVPDGVVDRPTADDVRWAAVEFELNAGSIDATEILRYAQLRAGGERYDVQALVVPSSGDTVLTDAEGSYVLESGSSGTAYYRVAAGAEVGDWLVDPLAERHENLYTRNVS